jgi:O-antigen/teichoic acid export membrane protein
VKNLDDVTGKRQFGKNLAIYWSVQVLVILSGFVIPRQISDHLGAVDLGTWDLGWAAYRYLSLTGIGAVGVTRYIAMYRAGESMSAQSRVFTVAILIQTLVAILVLSSAILLSIYVAKSGFGDFDKTAVSTLILLFSTAICFRFLGEPARGVITGYHRFDLHHLIGASQDFLLALGLIAALSFGAELVHLGYIVVLSAMLTSLVRFFFMRKVAPTIRFDVSEWSIKEARKLFRFGAKSLANSSAQLILFQTIAVVVGVLAGPTALAVYSRSQTLVRVSGNMLQKVANMFTPMASSLLGLDRREETRAMLLEVSAFFVLVILPFEVTMVFFGDLVVEVWMGPEYGNRLLIVIMAVGSLLPIASMGPLGVLAGMNAHGKIGIASLVITILSLALMVPYAHYEYGIDAVIGATIMSITWTLSRGLPVPFLLNLRFRISYGEYFLRVLFKPSMSSVPMVLFFYYSREALVVENYLIALMYFLSGMIFTAIIYWRFLLSDPIKSLITNRVGK